MRRYIIGNYDVWYIRVLAVISFNRHTIKAGA